ncbi:DUF2863 family protein [Thiomonas sp.]
MSTKRAARVSGRKKCSKTPPNWAREIFAAAEAATSLSADFNSEPSLRVGDLVAQALDTGTDHHVLRALEDLDDAGLDSAAKMVASWADTVSSHIAVTLRGEGLPEAEACDMTLFLVPLCLGTKPGAPVPTELRQPGLSGGLSMLDQAARSLRQQGLVGVEPSLLMLPYLYALSDLPKSWAQRWRLVRQCRQASLGQQETWFLPRKPPPAGDSVLALRFVLFAVTSSQRDADPGFLFQWVRPDDAPETGLAAAILEATSRLLGWPDAFGQILLSSLPGLDFVEVGMPAVWEYAIEEGVSICNLMGLQLAMTRVTRSSESVLGLSVRAAIGVYQTDGGLELRIGITGNDRFAGHVWMTNGDPEVELKPIVEALAELGVSPEQIQVDPDLREDAYCEDCGRPLFPGRGVGSCHEVVEAGDTGDRGHPRLH